MKTPTVLGVPLRKRKGEWTGTIPVQVGNACGGITVCIGDGLDVVSYSVRLGGGGLDGATGGGTAAGCASVEEFLKSRLGL